MIYFIVPAYNEAPNLPRLLSSIEQWSVTRRESCRLIVADDGSRDETVRILEAFRGFPVTVVSHKVNRGVHEAFRSAFEALGRFPLDGYDVVVSIEADNTSSLEILDKMIGQVRQGYDLVLASCYAPGGDVVGTNWVRRTLSFCANLILRCTPGMPVVFTFSSFYRAYRAPLLEQAFRSYGDRLIEEQGFVCVVEMLLKFGLLKARITEVPLILDGRHRRGASKMRIGRTIRGYLELFTRAVTGQLAKPSVEAGSLEGAVLGRQAGSD